MSNFGNHSTYGEQNAEILGDILSIGWAISRSPDYELAVTATGEAEILSSDLGIQLIDPTVLVSTAFREASEAEIRRINDQRLQEAHASISALAIGMSIYYETDVSPDGQATKLTYAARRIDIQQANQPRHFLDLAYTALSDLNRPLMVGERLQFKTAEDLFEADNLDITRFGRAISATRTYQGEPVLPPSPEQLGNLKQALQNFRNR